MRGHQLRHSRWEPDSRTWEDLSDDELRARIEQRLGSFPPVGMAIANRDRPETAQLISRWLGE